MPIVKKRTATLKVQQCGECKRQIELKESYFDTDEKIGKKPWNTLKFCQSCGETKGGVVKVELNEKTEVPAEEVKELPKA